MLSALIFGFLGTYTRMFFSKKDIIINFIISYFENRQKIQMAKVNHTACHFECKYKPSTAKEKISLNKKDSKFVHFYRILFASAILSLLLAYLGIDLFLIINYGTHEQLMKILSEHRELAINLCIYSFFWIITGSIENNFKKKL